VRTLLELAHVVDGGLVHSFDMQQLVDGMQRAPQALKLLLQTQAFEPLQLAFA